MKQPLRPGRPLRDTYIVVMAGGAGTRFWPRSRSRLPKQLLDIVGDRTMIEATVDRVLPLIEWSRILVVCGSEHARFIRRLLPRLPRLNLLAEPQGRNTAPCVAVAAEMLRQRGQDDAVMVILPSDHLISRPQVLRRCIRAAAARARQSGELITFGIVPRSAESGYGYIRLGASAGREMGSEMFRAGGFVEKPATERAAEMVRSGRYLWNSGMFVWTAAAILQEMERHLPAMIRRLRRAGPLVGPKRERSLRTFYQRGPSVSVDVGVMEKSDRTVVVPCDPGWNDIGSWSALYEVLSLDPTGSAARADWINVDSSGLLIESKKLVATVGVHNLVIIDAADALLVCDRRRAQDVRLVVEQLKRKGKKRYL
ncbi:MAG: mannose-1-phosphate guanylyltransferase [Acidobacteriota bacterium]